MESEVLSYARELFRVVDRDVRCMLNKPIRKQEIAEARTLVSQATSSLSQISRELQRLDEKYNGVKS